MHEIRLKRLVFSNILSYGNNENEVIFDNGLIWIKGPNGVGKSSILEALTFAFFGKPYRAITKSELRNTANKSKLYVMVEFERVDFEGSSNYQIIREMGMSGSSSFKINKDGDVEKKGAGVTQKKLEDEILGFNQIIWENVLSLNTIQTTPFIDMDAGEKRKLLESILTLQLDKMKDLNKKALKESNVKFNSATHDVIKYETDIKELVELIARMEKEFEDDIDVIKNEIAKYELNIKDKEIEKTNILSEIDVVTKDGIAKKKLVDAFGDIDSDIFRYNNYKMILNDIIKINDELTEVNGRLAVANEESVQASIICDESIKPSDMIDIIKDNAKRQESILSKLNNDCSNFQNKLTAIKIEGESLVAGIACPTCGKDSCEDDFKDRKESLRLEWKSLNAELKSCLVEIDNQKLIVSDANLEYTKAREDADAYMIKLNVFTLARSKCKSIEGELHKVMARLESKKLQIEDGVDLVLVDSKLDELRNSKEARDVINLEISNLRELIATKQQEIKGIISSIKHYNDEIVLNNAKITTKNEANSEKAITIAKGQLVGARDDFKRAKERVKKYSDEIDVTTYIEKMYDDSGIKKIILGIFVPNLNNAIAHNFSLFNLPFTLEFDDAMSYKFSGRYGSAQVYNGLSQGQKRKVNFAIAMAFRDFVTSIADFRVNALFLDEVLDISTDEESFVAMTELLRNKVPEVGGIYMMTHRGELISDLFDQMIEVEHDGLYSSISTKKIVRSSNY